MTPDVKLFNTYQSEEHVVFCVEWVGLRFGEYHKSECGQW